MPRDRGQCSVALLALLIAVPAEAGWPPGGARVLPSSSVVELHQLVADDAGGAYVLFESELDADASIRIGHFTGDGVTSQGWGPDGLELGRARPRPFGRAHPDGSGNVFASVWGSVPASTRRIGPQGAAVGAWSGHGVPVFFPFVVPDGLGSYVVYSSVGARILAVRFLADGSRDPAWPPGGRTIVIAANGLVTALPDASGGAFVLWTSGGGLSMLRTTQAAGPAPGWPADGVRMSGSISVGTVVAAADGAGGVIAVWEGGGDLLGQRIDGMGAPVWGPDPRPVCVASGVPQFPQVSADGSGGALVAWVDSREARDLYAVRLTAAGDVAPGWSTGGTFVARPTEIGWTLSSAPVGDGAGGMYLAWREYPWILAQHLTGTGDVAQGWSPGGTILNDTASLGPAPGQPRLVVASGGDAIVAWPREDGIWAKRVATDGLVPVAMSLVSAEASPDLVRLTWFGHEAAGVPFAVLRRDETGAWVTLAEKVGDADGRIVHEDREVVPGARYGYALRESGEEERLGEHWVEVPALATLELEGFVPNPSSPAPRVAFTLAEPGPARIEIYDIGGRRVAARSVAGPGRQVVEARPAGSLAPGLYLIRLRQGNVTRVTRGIVVE